MQYILGINPHLCNMNTYVINTNDLLHMAKDMQDSENDILGSFDMKNLFSNIAVH